MPSATSLTRYEPAEEPVLTPYVARPALEAALAAQAQAVPGVLVVGEAGTGKSRLVSAVVGEEALRTSVTTARFGSARDLVADLLSQLPAVPAGLLQLLRQGEAGTEELELLAAAGRQLAERGAQRPVVEDGELLTDREAAALDVAIEASGLPWVVVSRTRRPELGLSTLQVGSLDEDETTSLIRVLLPGADHQVVDALRARVGGRPLHLEQCTRLLLESGDLDLADGRVRVLAPSWQQRLPTSLDQFAAQRVALLPPAEREVLLTAAVLGDGLEPALLGHLAPGADRALPVLQDRGLLRAVPTYTGETRLSFSHALLREAAYASVPLERRRHLHLAAAEWYAVLPVSQVLESQAEHLEAALRLGDADCDLVRRTIAAMTLFARSIEAERPLVAAGVVGRAQGYAEDNAACAPDTLQLTLCASTVQFIAGEQQAAESSAAAALATAEARGDTSAEAEAHLLVAQGVMTADPSRSREHFDRAVELYRTVNDTAGEARALAQRALLLQHEQGIPQQIAELEQAHRVAMRSGDARLQSSTALQLALHHAFASGSEELSTWSERAMHAARRDDLVLKPSLDLASGALAFLGLAPTTGRASAEDALATGRELGLGFLVWNAVVAVVDLALLSGDLDAAARVLAEVGRPSAAARPTPWLGLQLDLLEARVQQRSGQVELARGLLEGVGEHELSHQAVLARDLAEAKSWVLLERGHFAEARALASQAAVASADLGERVPALRPRLVALVAAVVDGQTPALSDVATLRELCQTTQLPVPAQLALRWIYVDELTRGWTVDLYGLSDLDVIEARALDLEIEALSQGRFDLLASAAEVWAELGTTVWRARALLWHSELTGTAHPEATELLDVLDAPSGLEETLRAQVRGLRA